MATMFIPPWMMVAASLSLGSPGRTYNRIGWKDAPVASSVCVVMQGKGKPLPAQPSFLYPAFSMAIEASSHPSSLVQLSIANAPVQQYGYPASVQVPSLKWNSSFRGPEHVSVSPSLQRPGPDTLWHGGVTTTDACPANPWSANTNSRLGIGMVLPGATVVTLSGNVTRPKPPNMNV